MGLDELGEVRVCPFFCLPTVKFKGTWTGCRRNHELCGAPGTAEVKLKLFPVSKLSRWQTILTFTSSQRPNPGCCQENAVRKRTTKTKQKQTHRHTEQADGGQMLGGGRGG